MTLYWPAQDSVVVTDAPRLHALVIGVGTYHHYGLNATAPATLLTGLEQLTITAPAAKRITRWLEMEFTNPHLPLGSIELLLSPDETLTRDDGTPVAIEDANKSNVANAFDRWYARCNAHEGNIAFCYFAGHGISIADQRLLLMSDFGNPALPNKWKNCVDAAGMQSGMTSCKAQTQLFFLDACRDTPFDATQQKNVRGDPLVTADLSDDVDLSVAFSAASEGRKAYGRDGEETFFCQALMTCLNGVAARKAGAEWRVDTAALSSSMAYVIAIMAQVENEQLDCECPAKKPVVLHFPDGPRVVVKVGFDPDQLGKGAKIEVQQGGQTTTEVNDKERPWMGEVDFGQAHIEITIPGHPGKVVDDTFHPPTYEIPVQ